MRQPSAAPPSDSPRDEYQRRRAARQQTHLRLSRRYDAIAHARVAVAVVAAAIAWLAFHDHRLQPAWLVAPALAFVALVVVHEGIARARQQARRAILYHDQALARLDHRWMGQGLTGDRYADPDHLYAAHLDLFGRGSLFELLCTARTRAGQDALAGWLLTPAPPEVVRQRQAAVAELRFHLDLRESLALAGQELRLDRDETPLESWGNRAMLARLGLLQGIALALAAAAVATGALWAAGQLGPAPLGLVIVVEFVAVNLLRHRIDAVLLPATGAVDELQVIARLIRCIERVPFQTAVLTALQHQLVGESDSAARQIALLARRFELLDAARNQFFAPLAALLLWRTQMALWIERWRARQGPSIGPWLRAFGQLEALVAMAGYAYEHPEDVFPQVEANGPLLRGARLGHPLLPRERCVRNDVELGEHPSLLVVSGSNMSGKSTLLRTVGINTVLAQAGAPVCATELSLSTWTVGASLSVHDSLQEGASRFYAEVKRLRAIAVAAREGTRVLFLVDEILHGTNSADRRVGAQAVLEGLLQLGACGMITTHDLALTEMTQKLGPAARNVHFEDQLQDGRMVFDYRLRDGVVQKSNALELMRAVGLID